MRPNESFGFGGEEGRAVDEAGLAGFHERDGVEGAQARQATAKSAAHADGAQRDVAPPGRLEEREKDKFKLEACEAISAPCQGLSTATNQSNTFNPYQRRSVSRKNDHIHLLIPQTPPYQPRSLSRPSFPDDLPLWGRQSSGVLLRRVEALRALPRREDGH